MIAIAACLACQTIELAIYGWFFNYRYQNDNGNISNMLTDDVIRSRNGKNIGTFVGQFYGFLMEYSFLFVIFLLTFFADVKNNHTKAMLNMIKFVDFGLLSAVEVLSSPNLRAYLWRIVKGNWWIQGHLIARIKMDIFFINSKPNLSQTIANN